MATRTRGSPMKRTPAQQRELARLIASQSQDIRPARLGGKERRYTVSIPRDELQIRLPEPPPVVMNLDEVLAGLALDPDEIAYLRANEVDGIPRCDLHNHLGWTRARV